MLDAQRERSAALLPVILSAMNNAIEADANGILKSTVASAAIELAVAADSIRTDPPDGQRSAWSAARTARCCVRCWRSAPSSGETASHGIRQTLHRNIGEWFPHPGRIVRPSLQQEALLTQSEILWMLVIQYLHGFLNASDFGHLRACM